MSSKPTFKEHSYQRHAEYYQPSKNEKYNGVDLEKFFNTLSVNGWRHQRMYQMLDPLIEADEKSTWLTVGDGRYGIDAKYLLNKGADTHASDISDVLLKEAHAAGYIPKYSCENAEALSFDDNHFDYTFCKEAYHHFPRPMIALYEMLRVSRKGVFLIEPNDIYVDAGIMARIFWQCKNIIKSVIGKPLNKKHAFEDLGNYMFSISQREIEKVALGLNLKYVAFKYLNDVFLPGADAENFNQNGPFLKKFNRIMALTNALCKLGFMQYRVIGFAIFKDEPSALLKSKLETDGFELVTLPDNPYA
jgi:ubiquinone/menaquinone biosynthesis C-methylase UbiE